MKADFCCFAFGAKTGSEKNAISAASLLLEDFAQQHPPETLGVMTPLSLFNAANVNNVPPSRQFPEHGTPPARLLAALVSGSVLTHDLARDEYKIHRLPMVVQQLIEFGWNVVSDVQYLADRYSECSWLEIFKLHPDDLAWADGQSADYVLYEIELMDSLDAQTEICR